MRSTTPDRLAKCRCVSASSSQSEWRRTRTLVSKEFGAITVDLGDRPAVLATRVDAATGFTQQLEEDACGLYVRVIGKSQSMKVPVFSLEAVDSLFPRWRESRRFVVADKTNQSKD